MARTLNGKLTGKAAHGIDEIMVDEPSTLTAEDRARIKADIENNYHSYNATRWAGEVKVDVDKFLLAMDFIKLQESQEWKSEAIAQEADAKDWQDQTTQLRNGG